MCGRYTVTAETRRIEERFGARFVSGTWEPTYNAAPSQLLPIITNERPKEIIFARWGFLPEWAPPKTQLTPQINARVEGIERKRMFMDAYHGRHCLVIGDGFYEWAERARHEPYRFVLRNKDLLAFAGIWARRQNEPARFAILTTAANELVKEIHHRMPVILTPGSEKTWLPASPSGMTIFPATPPEMMISYRVTSKINRPNFNEPDAVAPLEMR